MSAPLKSYSVLDDQLFSNRFKRPVSAEKELIEVDTDAAVGPGTENHLSKFIRERVIGDSRAKEGGSNAEFEIPYLDGDTHRTLYVGDAGTTTPQDALLAASGTGVGVQGQSWTGTGGVLQNNGPSGKGGLIETTDASNTAPACEMKSVGGPAGYLNGGLACKQRTVNSAATLTTNDLVVICQAAANPGYAVNLPAAASCANSVFVVIIGAGITAPNAVTITPAGGNINGAATYAAVSTDISITVISDGTNYYRIT